MAWRDTNTITGAVTPLRRPPPAVARMSPFAKNMEINLRPSQGHLYRENCSHHCHSACRGHQSNHHCPCHAYQVVLHTHLDIAPTVHSCQNQCSLLPFLGDLIADTRLVFLSSTARIMPTMENKFGRGRRIQLIAAQVVSGTLLGRKRQLQGNKITFQKSGHQYWIV